MSKPLIIGLALHAIIAIILVVLLWKKHETIFTKIMWSVIIIVPFMGPIFYGAFFNPPPRKTGNKSKISKSEAINHALAAEEFNDR